jgi:hypothetical protein
MNVVEGAKIRRGEEVKLRGVDSQGDAALQCRRLGNREISTDYDKTGKFKTLIIQAEIERTLLCFYERKMTELRPAVCGVA